MLNFNSSPYFDDFDPSKNYHRILFKPGAAVQGRELTQAQTILQNQISNFADNIFTQNTPVKGGKVTLNLNCTFVRLNLQYNGENVVASNFLNKIIQDESGTVLARVIATSEATGTTVSAGDPPTLVITYLSGIHFSDGMTIVTDDGTNISATVSTSTLANPSTGKSSVASVSDGIFYVVNGYSVSSTQNADGTYSKYSIGNFVALTPQTIILDKYDNAPSARVGLQINETIVDYISDSSLLDPAIGASNYQAPGADRYQVTLSLTSLPLTLGNDDAFIELVRIQNGAILKQVDGTVYSVIDDYFAKRDYETNGDYIVNDFKITPSPNAAGDTSKYDLSIGKGVAYVHGYRIENQSNYVITNNRARTSNTINSQSLGIDYGSYFYVDTLSGIFDVTTYPTVDFHCVGAAQINSANATTYNSTLIGTGYMRNLQYVYDLGSSNTSSYVYRAYVSEISTSSLTGNVLSATATTITLKDTNGTFSAVANAYYGATIAIIGGTNNGDRQRIASYNVTTKTVTVASPFIVTPDATSIISIIPSTSVVESIVQKTGANTVVSSVNINTSSGKVNGIATGDTVFNNPGYPELLFKLGNPYVSTVSGSNYYSTKVYRNYSLTGLGGTTSFTLSASGLPWTFVTGSSSTLTSDIIKNNFIVLNKTTGKLLDFSTSGNTVTSTGTSVTFSSNTYTNGTAVEVIAKVFVNNGDNSSYALKTKTLNNGNITTVSGSLTTVTPTTSIDLTKGQVYVTNAGTSNGKISLYTTDVKRILKIIDTKSTSASPTNAMLTSSTYDITNLFSFNNGQRDSLYDHASISLIPGAPKPLGNILIIFDYYAHTGGDGYFTINSYVNETYANVVSSIYTSKNGTKYHLSDVLDFRPSRVSGQAAYALEYSSSPSSSDIGVLIPQDVSNFTSNYSYYLGRKDKLVLTKDNSFNIIQGTPAITPLFPTEPNGSLVLANITHDPYTSFVPGEGPTGTPINLSINKVAHQRWIKSDITDLQTRVNNLEYYTSLSLLEQNAQSLQVPDVNGLNRFKNGILVDDFSSFATADTQNPDYAAKIDVRNQQLAPLQLVNNFQLQNPVVLSSLGTLNKTNTYAIRSIQGTNTNIFTLPFTTANLALQPLASSAVSLNPFNVSIIQGTAQLNPPMDNWVDVNQAPSLIITDPGIEVYQQDNGVNITNSGDFATIPGTSTTVTSSRNVEGHGINPSPYGYVGYTETTTSTYAAQIQNITTSGNFTQVSSSLATNNGYLTNIAILPYIRPQQLAFITKGLLTNTPVSVWFDGQDINKYITTPDTLELNSVSGKFNVGDIVGFYESSTFKPTARVIAIHQYANTSNTRLYVSTIVGMPVYSSSNKIQNGLFDASGSYTTSTASGKVNSSATSSLSTSGQITGVGGSYTLTGNTIPYMVYKVSNPHDWGTFLNQYGVWGDLNNSNNYNFTYAVTVPAGTYTVTAAVSGGSAALKANGTTILTATSPTTVSTTTYTQATTGTVGIGWTISDTTAHPKGFAVVIKDSSGNIVFNATNPPNVTYDSAPSEIAMPMGGAWFTGATKVKLANTASSITDYYKGCKIQVTSNYITQYVTETATYVPPPPAKRCGGGSIICQKLAELGFFSDDMNAADQRFAVWLKKTDPKAHAGYLRWASTVVDLMNGGGSESLRKVLFFWIRGDKGRIEAQKRLVSYYVFKIAGPWAQEMAHRMGANYESNPAGRMIMNFGLPLCRRIGKLQTNKNIPLVAKILTIWGITSVLLVSVIAISSVNGIKNKMKKVFNKILPVKSINNR
ncbi:Domain of unknown function DUF4815 [uncultured Caudovirales phage]|uniref:DUF4815 domain-containing protein n=1 Tax=uncultured Caudovirales phage TaxID=2100421 RepID=A0A6J5LIK6_9CAUD|nr:Domain of unknown function DUF4815 [uncultured Caudovirales phage]